MAAEITQCPACEGTGIMHDFYENAVHHYPCRCCTGLGEFPASEMLERVKDFKTWPDSVRRELGCSDCSDKRGN